MTTQFFDVTLTLFNHNPNVYAPLLDCEGYDKRDDQGKTYNRELGFAFNVCEEELVEKCEEAKSVGEFRLKLGSCTGCQVAYKPA